MSYPRTKGSKKWKGIAKRTVFGYIDSYNRLFTMLDLDYRLKMVQKPRIGHKQKESQ